MKLRSCENSGGGKSISLMIFYDRKQELELLAQTRDVAFNSHSQMTVLTGRRRIGKTKLILKSCEDTPTVYLFVRRSNEAALCSLFAETASRSLNTYIPREITSFVSLFETLMTLGKNQSFNLVIDEFQEFFISIHPYIAEYKMYGTDTRI